jgi:hypothetical protein
VLSSDAPKEQQDRLLATLIEQQQYAAPILEDRLTTGLANLTLKRRDSILQHQNAKKVSQETKSHLRSSSLLEENLFDLPKEIIEKEMLEVRNKELISALRQKQTVNVKVQGQKFQQFVPQPQPQQQHAQANLPFSAPNPTTPAEFSGQKNFKPQKGRGKGKGQARGKGSNKPRGRGRGKY